MFRVSVHNDCLLKRNRKNICESYFSERNVWVDRSKLIVKRLVHVIKEVLVRTGRQVIRNASASLLLKELTPDIVDRLRDGSSPPADRR